jgi:threonine synthase
MRYISTRGGSSAEFGDVLLGGPAADGGLYLPDAWPQLSEAEIASFGNLPYADVAFRVMRPFVSGAFDDAEFRADIDAAYATFAHKDVVPVVKLGADRFLLELFHGPTFAFKDVAMQLLGRLFARALKKQQRRATVIVATSGDTGSAAIAALRGLPGVDVVVLHPHQRTSEIQRRQMTTVLDSNVHNIAVQGSFDDAQNIVKALFADSSFASRTQLTAVNSINFARIMAQCVYYFTAAAAIAGRGRAPTFVVPTGNFGDVFAGEAAARMGLPVERLVIATNSNDILVRTLSAGIYSSGRAQQTLSPSMDIQVASNFERAVFEAAGRDGALVGGLMQLFAATRSLPIPSRILTELQHRYLAASGNDNETRDAIARVHKETGMVIDPHTAVGVAASLKLQLKGPTILLATAHSAKFPEAIAQAIGIASEIPEKLAGLSALEERYTVLPNEVGAVRTFVLERTGTL